MLRPRPHLSWSQMFTLESSEERYISIYFQDEKMPINQGMAYGKKMADALENDEATGDIVSPPQSQEQTQITFPFLLFLVGYRAVNLQNLSPERSAI